MIKRRIARLIVILALLLNLLPSNIFALEPRGATPNTNSTAHVSIGYKYAVESVDYNIQSPSGAATGRIDDATYTGPVNANLDPDKKLNYDHSGTISVDVHHTSEGIIDGDPEVYISGNALGDVWSQGDNGEYYKLDSDGNVLITTAEGVNSGTALTLTIKSGKGTSLDDFYQSVNDSAEQLQTWSAKAAGSVSTSTMRHDEIAQFENTPTVNINGQTTQLEGDGKSKQAQLDSNYQQGEASRDAYNDQKNKTNDDPCYENAGPLGWVMCPALKAVSGFVSVIYQDIVKNYLQVEAGKILESGGATYTAWSSFRDIANIAFVIGLLAVIISQLTGYGIDNYGIKRMLPRLIVAAILVNLSFFICQIIVDLANVAGASIGGILSPSTLGISPPETADGIDQDVYSVFLLLAGGAATYIFIDIAAVLITLPAVIMCLFAVISAAISVLFLWFILIARQAVVVILVVISPLALVAYLFPNTEHLAKRYIKIATGVLILYPLCEFVINGGQLAGVILADVGQSTGKDSLVLVAMIVQVAPFFAIPSLLKSSLKGVGNLGAKISDIGRNTRGKFDQARKSEPVQDMYMSSIAKNKRLTSAIRGLQGRKGLAGVVGNMAANRHGHAQNHLIGKLSQSSQLERNANDIARMQTDDYQKAMAQANEDEAREKSVATFSSVLSRRSDDEVEKTFKESLGGNNIDQAVAAMDIMYTNGNGDAARKVYQDMYAAGNITDEMRHALANNMLNQRKKGLYDPLSQGWAKKNARDPEATALDGDEFYKDNFNELSAEGLASLKTSTMGKVKDFAQSQQQSGNSQYMNSLLENAAYVRNEDNGIWGRLDGGRRTKIKDILSSASLTGASAPDAAPAGQDFNVPHGDGEGQQTTTTPTPTPAPATPTPSTPAPQSQSPEDNIKDTIAKINTDASVNQDGAAGAPVVIAGSDSSASSSNSSSNNRSNMRTVNVEKTHSKARKLGKAARGEQIDAANQAKAQRYGGPNTTGDGKNTVFMTGDYRPLDLSPKTPPTKNT